METEVVVEAAEPEAKEVRVEVVVWVERRLPVKLAVAGTAAMVAAGAEEVMALAVTVASLLR